MFVADSPLLSFRSSILSAARRPSEARPSYSDRAESYSDRRRCVRWQVLKLSAQAFVLFDPRSKKLCRQALAH